MRCSSTAAGQPDEKFYGRLDEWYDSLLRVLEVHRVYLEDWRERPVPTVGLQLLQLVILAPAAVGQRAADLAQRVRDPGATRTLPAAEWLDLIERILVYRLPQIKTQGMRGMREP